MAQTLGKHIRRFNTLESTNEFAQSILTEHPVDGTIILADYQSQGKGQKGRVWEVAPGQNLTFSLIVYPTFVPIIRMFMLSKVVALAVRDTIHGVLPDTNVQIKWPNDILINGKKTSGILIENQLEGTRIKNSIWGIGLNVNQQYFPEHLIHKATSLSKWTRKTLSVEGIMFQLIEQLNLRYEMLWSGKTEILDRDYLSHLLGYQEEIKVELEGEEEICHLVGINPSGQLALVRHNKLAYYGVGEVRIIPDFLPS